MASNLSGTYVIENIITAEKYVGQAIDLLKRRKQHFDALASGTRPNRKLQADFSKYGASAFRWRPMLAPEDSLSEMERHWKDTLDATYNQAPIPKKEINRSNKTIQEIRRQIRRAKRRKSTHS